MPHLRPGDKFKLNRMTDDNKPVILHCQITRATQTRIDVGEPHEFTFVVKNVTSGALLTHAPKHKHSPARVSAQSAQNHWSGHGK